MYTCYCNCYSALFPCELFFDSVLRHQEEDRQVREQVAVQVQGRENIKTLGGLSNQRWNTKFQNTKILPEDKSSVN